MPEHPIERIEPDQAPIRGGALERQEAAFNRAGGEVFGNRAPRSISGAVPSLMFPATQ
jgi:hypothetical protein